MTQEALLSYAEQHGHDVVPFDLTDVPACAIEDEEQKYHMAVSKSATQSEQKVYVAHELGHCEYAGLHTHYSPYVLRSKVEYKANKWAYLRLCPVEQLRTALRAGYRTLWELADYFDVTEPFMQGCLEYYKTTVSL